MTDEEQKRLRVLEVDMATLQTRVGLIQTVVFGVVGLICSSVVVGIISLVVAKT